MYENLLRAANEAAIEARDQPDRHRPQNPTEDSSVFFNTAHAGEPHGIQFLRARSDNPSTWERFTNRCSSLWARVTGSRTTTTTPVHDPIPVPDPRYSSLAYVDIPDEPSAWTRFTNSCSSLWVSVTGWLTSASVEDDRESQARTPNATSEFLSTQLESIGTFFSNLWERVPSLSGNNAIILSRSDTASASSHTSLYIPDLDTTYSGGEDSSPTYSGGEDSRRPTYTRDH